MALKKSVISTKKKYEVIVDDFDLQIIQRDPKDTSDYDVCQATDFKTGDIEISCGIQQLWDINSLNKILSNLSVYNISEEEVITKFNEIIKRMKNVWGAAFIICSTNRQSKRVADFLEKVCIQSTDWKKSPNTGNNIAIWIL